MSAELLEELTMVGSTFSAEFYEKARCGPADIPLLFPTGGRAARSKIRALCGECPVRALCREGALERRETSGIWGGLHFTRDAGTVVVVDLLALAEVTSPTGPSALGDVDDEGSEDR